MQESTKKALRLTMDAIRRQLSAPLQAQSLKKIIPRIQTLPAYKTAKHIALYRATAGEIDLAPLWHKAVLHAKSCYFPVTALDKTLHFYPATPDTPFKRGLYNILEPTCSSVQSKPLNDLDIIFIPLLAFDRQGTRLGWGAGCYDRTLAHAPAPLLIGIAYDFQCQPWLLREPWDIALDAIITPSATYWCDQGEG